MKKSTIWLRLNTAQAIIIFLLLVNAGLAFWVEKTLSTTEQRRSDLTGNRNRISYDINQTSGALRWLLIEPKNDDEKKQRTEAENDLKDVIDQLQSTFANQPGLVKSLKNLHDFSVGALHEFHNQTLELLATNPVAATTFYNQNQGAIRKLRDPLLSDLATKADQVKNDEAAHAKTIAVAGLICIILVFVACGIVGRLQSSAVTVPLNRLVSALERMRHGDFTQRVELDRKDEFGVLGDGLNRLADDLSVLVGQVQRSGIQVNTTATEICRDRQGAAEHRQ